MSVPPPVTAFFGGSFDPVHNGHLYVARTVHEQTPFKTILFVPNRANPLKREESAAAPHHRAGMVQEAIRDLDWCSVSLAEIEGPVPSYTARTIAHLIGEGRLVSRPGMIIGDDLLEQLPQWHDAKTLLSRVVLILVRRSREEVDYSRFDLPPDAVILQNDPVVLSSTAVRTRLLAGKPITDLVPECVHEYILRHRVYQ